MCLLFPWHEFIADSVLLLFFFTRTLCFKQWELGSPMTSGLMVVGLFTQLTVVHF